MSTFGLWSPRRVAALLAPAACIAALLGGCGSTSSSSSGSAGKPSSGSAAGHGSVDVLYAGSLENVMNTSIGPAFQKATGYSLTGFPAGSKDLANEIKGKVRQGDVFISASPKVNSTLEGSANGDWLSWYAPFASTSLVIGYNPNSSFAAALRKGPWYRVMARPGIRIGFTDPKLDPKGVLAVAALKQAAISDREPALNQVATSQSDLFPEQDLVGRLQSGQLDAGFFYTVEANAAKIPTVTLDPIHEKATYTVTVLKRAPDEAGAIAFVKFLLGAQGQALLRGVGLTVTSAPVATGTAIPAGLSQVKKAPQ
jgi:molybdate/tungstate transport system substrate-binding protein